jgi:hypothetical protein
MKSIAISLSVTPVEAFPRGGSGLGASSVGPLAVRFPDALGADIGAKANGNRPSARWAHHPPEEDTMISNSTRCDRIIALIDACLAEFGMLEPTPGPVRADDPSPRRRPR